MYWNLPRGYINIELLPTQNGKEPDTVPMESENFIKALWNLAYIPIDKEKAWGPESKIMKVMDALVASDDPALLE